VCRARVTVRYYGGCCLFANGVHIAPDSSLRIWGFDSTPIYCSD
jgi:hypothetical protein